MIYKVGQPLALVCIFLWIGFICAISFMESWLKFRAPGVTLSIGLSIGRIIFNVLNKIEWVFALIVICSMVWNKTFLTWQNGYFLTVLIILALQTFWLLPALDKREQAVINNQVSDPSNTHLYFIVAEILKLAGLIIAGLFLFEQQ